MRYILFVLLFAAFVANSFCNEEPKIARARVESCPGCMLNRLPDVKKFIFEDIPKYENVEFKRIQGAPPELVLLNDSDEEIERIKLRTYNREQCNELLTKRGFKLKDESQRNEL